MCYLWDIANFSPYRFPAFIHTLSRSFGLVSLPTSPLATDLLDELCAQLGEDLPHVIRPETFVAVRQVSQRHDHVRVGKLAARARDVLPDEGNGQPPARCRHEGVALERAAPVVFLWGRGQSEA